MIKIKPGVRVAGLGAEILLAIDVANGVFAGLGLELVITSAVEGSHSRASLHYAGNAVDLRSRHIPTLKRKRLERELRAALGKDRKHEGDYDLVIESNHWHLEFQPKRGINK